MAISNYIPTGTVFLGFKYLDNWKFPYFEIEYIHNNCTHTIFDVVAKCPPWINVCPGQMSALSNVHPQERRERVGGEIDR